MKTRLTLSEIYAQYEDDLKSGLIIGEELRAINQIDALYGFREAAETWDVWKRDPKRDRLEGL